MKKYSKESLGPYWKKELNIGDEVEIQLMEYNQRNPFFITDRDLFKNAIDLI